jgi:hypothetical protein
VEEHVVLAVVEVLVVPRPRDLPEDGCTGDGISADLDDLEAVLVTDDRVDEAAGVVAVGEPFAVRVDHRHQPA